jgi:DNA (cytosine-5)-methyltransferase 1
MIAAARKRTVRRASRDGVGFTAVEFFAGIGLVRLALERKGWRVLFANDIDPEKRKMYEANFGGEHFRLGDIHKLSVDDIPRCTLFTASFPCNDLSIAGTMEGLSGKESSAFWGLIQILRQLKNRRPPLVLLENVMGFLMSQGGKDFETAMLALNECGYTVDAFILNAVHWAPQSRSRLFIVGKQTNGDDVSPFTAECGLRPAPLAAFINLHQNIKWDIRKLPKLPKPKAKLVDIIEDLSDDDPRWWNQDGIAGYLRTPQLTQRVA